MVVVRQDRHFRDAPGIGSLKADEAGRAWPSGAASRRFMWEDR
jgi:hypothetical protein